MRLFVAVSPPDAALDELEAATAPLRSDWPALRWTNRDAWHITVSFLGEVEERAAARLPARLARSAARHPAMALSISGAGTFPGGARARILWTGISGEVTALEALAKSTAAQAAKAGAPPPEERRGYRPHLTLARCRAPADLRPLVDDLAGFSGKVWPAEQIHLIRSLLGPHPRYQTLGSWPLKP